MGENHTGIFRISVMLAGHDLNFSLSDNYRAKQHEKTDKAIIYVGTFLQFFYPIIIVEQKMKRS